MRDCAGAFAGMDACICDCLVALPETAVRLAGMTLRLSGNGLPFGDNPQMPDLSARS